VTTATALRPAALRRPREAAGDRVPVLQRPLASYHLVLWAGASLLVLGLVMVLSASSVKSYDVNGSSYTVFTRQVVWFALGVPVTLVAVRLPVRVWRWAGYPLLLASTVGLLLVLVPGVGTHTFGATRWIDIGPLQLQPSEPAKLGLALWGADLLVRKQKLLHEWKHLLVPLVPVAAFLAALVMLEPDMGTTIALLLVVVALLFVVGAPLRIFGGFVAVVAAAGTLLAVTEPYRLARLTSVSNPCADSLGKGLQACHGLFALGSGGWWGEGLGASREKWSYLPNAHTDYIFAIIGEELGLVGTLLVVGLFGLLGYAGLRVASRTRDPFVRLAAAAVTTWLVGQAVINMGYVTGLLPVTGIPLPLISFGGTSLVLTMGSVGMLAAFARTEPGVTEVLAARGPGRVRRLLAPLRRQRPAATGGTRPVRRPARRRAAAGQARLRRPAPPPPHR